MLASIPAVNDDGYLGYWLSETMNWVRLFWTAGLVAVAGLASAGFVVNKSVNVYHDVMDMRDQVRYLVDSGDTVGAAAEDALSAAYLELIFGANPELLEQVKKAVERGMKESPDSLDGDVSAILVTYRRNGDENVEQVVAHVIGEFPLGRRTISMNRDGFFADQIDNNLWQTGNAAIRFLGRDMIVWSNSEDEERSQRELIEAAFAGEIVILAESIAAKPLHFTMVLPAPQDLVPPRMRAHVRAILFNGSLAPDQGSMEMVLLTDSSRSASLVTTMMEDLRLSSLIALRTQFLGVKIENPWPPAHPEERESWKDEGYVPVWWAYEMASTLEMAEVTRRELTVTMTAEYGRRMVNAVLKAVERFGRDYSQLKGQMEEKLDPRVVDARMQTHSPGHYWTTTHRWGPDWPFGASTNLIIQRPEENQEPAPAITETL